MTQPLRFNMDWRNKTLELPVRGLVYFEPARASRTILAWRGVDGGGVGRFNVPTPSLAIVHLRLGNNINLVHLLRLDDKAPVAAREAVQHAVYHPLMYDLCVGLDAYRGLCLKEITAPEAVWMTVWHQDVVRWGGLWPHPETYGSVPCRLDELLLKNEGFSNFAWLT